jgi:hypothetical protein
MRLDYTLRPINPRVGEQRGPDFTVLNPNAKLLEQHLDLEGRYF